MESGATLRSRSAVGTILVLLLSLVIGTGTVGATTDQLDQSQIQASPQNEATGANQTQHAAQTFVAGITGGLDRVSVPVYIQNGNPGDLIVEIRRVDGSGAPATLLGATSVPQARIPRYDGVHANSIDATFRSPVPVVKGTQYALVLSSTSGDSGPNGGPFTGSMCYWVVSPQDIGGNAYLNGTIWVSIRGGSWSRYDYHDFVFKTYMISDTTVISDTTAPTTTPSLIGTQGTGGYYHSAVSVTLTATDPDGAADIAATAYTVDGGAQQTYTAPFTVTGNGTHTLTYFSTDQAGNGETAKSLTIQIDTTPPTIEAVATPSSIWPPDHKLVDVSVAVTLTDSVSGADGFLLLSATASGDPSDLQGFTVGTGSTEGQVRANKDEVYTLTYQGKDKAGNSATAVVTISVPHDQGH